MYCRMMSVPVSFLSLCVCACAREILGRAKLCGFDFYLETSCLVCNAAHPMILIQAVELISSTVAPQRWSELMSICDSYCHGYKSLNYILLT